MLSQGSAAVDKELKRIKFPHGAVIGAIVRGEQVIIPNGDTVIKPYDHLMVFAYLKAFIKLKSCF